MSNQQTPQIYRVKDLPASIQSNLLRLQNSDGDFLRVRYVSVTTRGSFLVCLLLAFVLFLADFEAFFENSPKLVFDLKWQLVLAGGILLFALCASYLFWGFWRGHRSPVKKGIYLTPTEVIETFDGLIRYRELKDVSEIDIDKFQGGWRASLDVRFPDGELYKYNLYMNVYGALPVKKIAEAEKWRDKAEGWRTAALAAAERGDRAYFETHDIFQKSAAADLPAIDSLLSPRLMMRLMLAGTIAMGLLAFVTFWIFKLSLDS